MLRVTLSKLEKYCQESGGYDLHVKDDSVELTFVPTFPEALEKGESDPPRVRMSGTIVDGKIDFDSVEVEDPVGKRTRDQVESEMVYRSWLEYIEEKY